MRSNEMYAQTRVLPAVNSETVRSMLYRSNGGLTGQSEYRTSYTLPHARPRDVFLLQTLPSSYQNQSRTRDRVPQRLPETTSRSHSSTQHRYITGERTLHSPDRTQRAFSIHKPDISHRSRGRTPRSIDIDRHREILRKPALSHRSPVSDHRTGAQSHHAIGTDSYYLSKMRDILYDRSHQLVRSSITQITDNIYIGNYHDANNTHYLRRLGITHVLNCAALHPVSKSPYTVHSGIIGYEQFMADDREGYNILQHVPRARDFITSAQRGGGKVLVHCAMGINRSATIIAAHLMADQRMSLLHSVMLLKRKRGTVLCNPGFQKQLVWFARNHGLL